MMALLFFIVAILYSMVGFGGGSSYIALMILFDVPFELLPKVALICNLIVVSGGCYHFIRQGHFKWHLAWPFVVSSVPMAFVGGQIPISREFFVGLLGLVLLLAGLKLLFTNSQKALLSHREVSLKAKILAGGLIGLISGLVGIGGGIFLSPFLLNLRWAKPKGVAALASVFILVNSLAGLAGQLLKQEHFLIGDYLKFVLLFLAVFLGGQIGSWLGSGRLSPLWVRGATASLVLFVGGRLVYLLFQ